MSKTNIKLYNPGVNQKLLNFNKKRYLLPGKSHKFGCLEQKATLEKK